MGGGFWTGFGSVSEELYRVVRPEAEAEAETETETDAGARSFSTLDSGKKCSRWMMVVGESSASECDDADGDEDEEDDQGAGEVIELVVGVIRAGIELGFGELQRERS
ncbi:hypothetical protein AXG93_2269s1090 [Marchantia polymorpha subsp. ruderalis]|uniref:Uncharacterized protein n=1 Tax=Marchantia polymorpha subsp. ruderalis TaxID=1480154 RepID=A0A176VIG4_MARPO|nr:hypothetical protein AXG93_2269s1090 [Marchantia polymorpha subsp. ruderalis]